MLYYNQWQGIVTITGQDEKGEHMEDNMTSKEFDLLISMILEMLKDGQTEKVIKLLEETKNGSDK